VDNLYRNTFKDMMNFVVDADRCCECGSCVLVCPHNVIEYIDDRPQQTAKKGAAFDYCGISEGVGCDVCAAVCPRLWPREQHLKAVVYGDEPSYDGIFGVYRHIFVARTRDDGILNKAQDGGVVTALLAWARETGRIDGAIVSAVGEGDAPCFPSPKVATTVEDIRASSSSWYTYCPNNLALEDAVEQDLKKIAFVGVPCQITPLRKMENVDPSILLTEKKKPKIVGKQREFLRGIGERISFNIGLFCTEVFEPTLMTERVEKEMGIPLTDVTKFNVKGEVLIYKNDGDVATIPLQEAAEKYQRPECQHCGDFSAEMADIACGGIGTDRQTVVVLRTRKGVDIWREFEASGLIEVEPIQDNKRAWNILQRLSRKQRNRVPDGEHRNATASELPQYSPKKDHHLAINAIAATGKTPEEIAQCLEVAYGKLGEPRDIVGYIGGQPIPGDPGDPLEGEKRKLPPPPSPEQGGHSPTYSMPADAASG
jgi:coenzyme F420 hydrogenase subunit beta